VKIRRSGGGRGRVSKIGQLNLAVFAALRKLRNGF
jgi:hypothetical protein